MRTLFLIILTGLFLAACGTTITTKDRIVIPDQIENWQSFAWKTASTVENDSNYANANRVIRASTEQRLTDLGYRKVAKEDADFILNNTIIAHFETEKISEREERALRTIENLHQGPGSGFERIEHQQGEGFLRMTMRGPDGKLVWYGQVESVLDYQGQGTKKISPAIRKLLANFPASKK